MSIERMLLLSSMALAAIAFAAPAVAQADVTLTENNQPLAAGIGVIATSTNFVTTFGSGIEVTCAKVTLHYEVEANNDEEVVLQPTQSHNATTENCKLTTTNAVPEVGHPVTFTNFGFGELTINTWGTGVVGATLTNGPCNYTGNVHVETTANTTDILKATGSTLAAPGCPTGTMHGDFTLETSNGTAVTLHSVSTG